MGYLEGTGKSLHTLKNYRLDVQAFHSYLQERIPGRILKLEEVGRAEIEGFHQWMKTQGLRNNTRRRKLLTVGRFLGYLNKRDKVPDEAAHKFPAPHKIERIPAVAESQALITAIRTLSAETVLDARNRALLWTLAETGCLVSEACRIRFEDFSEERGKGRVRIGGKAARDLSISNDLLAEIRGLAKRTKGEGFVFQGFNRHGSLGGAISSRGVELLVRHYAERLGYPALTPRTFRHSAVLRWFKEEVPQDEIQKRLGLKTAYAFRAYSALLNPV